MEVVLNMRENMERLQSEVAELLCFVRDELLEGEDELREQFAHDVKSAPEGDDRRPQERAEALLGARAGGWR